MSPSPHIAAAPMMDCTDRHCRYLYRLMSRHIVLYSEMITAQAILHGDLEKLLGYNTGENPLILQVGGSDPEKMAKAVKLAEPFGYDGYNINVGCPSPRVSSGRFGACLMYEPTTVAACVTAMRGATDKPVTVKTRLGVDDQDSDEHLYAFINTVAAAGCDTFILHARKAWLKGLNPKQNRTIPPLQYERVHRLKQAFPNLHIIINGGLATLPAIAEQLQYCDGVMIGRALYDRPFLAAELEQAFWQTPLPDRHDVARQYCDYVANMQQQGCSLPLMLKHAHGLFAGLPGAKAWRTLLSEDARRLPAGAWLESVENFLCT